MKPEREAVWAQTTAGGLLHDLFGYFPTLHDARVRELEFDRAADRLSMTVDYRDIVTDSDGELTVRMRLEWTGVEQMDLRCYGNDLYHIDLCSADGLIVAEFEQCYGIYGKVSGRVFEVVLLQVDPPEPDADEEHW